MSFLSENNPTDKPLNKDALCHSFCGIALAITWFLVQTYYFMSNTSLSILAFFSCLTFIYASLALLTGNKWLTYSSQIIIMMRLICDMYFIGFVLSLLVIDDFNNKAWGSVICATVETIYAILILRSLCKRNKQLYGATWINPFLPFNNQNFSQITPIVYNV